ncbi:MAG: hypothetical protein ACRDHP_07780 [Ktedonobacterales bacterium]
MQYRLPPQPMLCSLLVIDADEARGQRLARLLTLAGYRPHATASPFQALERYLGDSFFPQAIVLGQMEEQQEFLLTRLVQRMLRDRAETPPLISMPLDVPDEAPILVDPLQPFYHTVSDECIRVLEMIWRALPATRTDFRMAERSLALTVLPQQGFQPRVSRRLRSRNGHMRQILTAALELIGPPRWEALMTDVGLTQYRNVSGWPPEDDDLAIPAEYPSLLNQAVVFSNPDDAVTQLRQWSDIGTQASLARHRTNALVQQALKLLSQEQVMSLVLKSYTNEMNEIRDEDLHTWMQRPDGTYCVVHYSNLYAYGRISRMRPECHVWLASLEATLRLVNLEAAWEVVEIECSCQTFTGHCVFLIRPRDGAQQPMGIMRSVVTGGRNSRRLRTGPIRGS